MAHCWTGLDIVTLLPPTMSLGEVMSSVQFLRLSASVSVTETTAKVIS